MSKRPFWWTIFRNLLSKFQRVHIFVKSRKIRNTAQSTRMADGIYPKLYILTRQYRKKGSEKVFLWSSSERLDKTQSLFCGRLVVHFRFWQWIRTSSGTLWVAQEVFLQRSWALPSFEGSVFCMLIRLCRSFASMFLLFCSSTRRSIVPSREARLGTSSSILVLQKATCINLSMCMK